MKNPYNQEENCKNFAVKCLNILRNQSEPAWNKAIEIVLSDGFGGMTSETGVYIGSVLADMTDANAETLRSELDEAISSNNADAGQVAIYRAVLGASDPDIWQTEPWSTHLQEAVTRCEQMYGSPDFMERILPAIAVLMPYTEQGTAANFLPALFANAAGYPDSYIRAHRAFHRHWPRTDDQSSDYQPDKIVRRACQFIRENATNADIDTVFLSLIELVEKKLIPEDTHTQISEIVPLVWQTAPDAVSAHATVVLPIITPTATVDLLTRAQPPDVDEATLTRLLTTIAENYDHQRRVETAMAILNAQPVKLAGELDGALATWFAAMGEHTDEVALALFVDKSLNDEQQVRVTMLLSRDFWKADDFSLLGVLLTNREAPITQGRILSELSDIVRTFNNGPARKALTTTLIDALPQLNAAQIDTVAREINSLQGQFALGKATETLHRLDEEQLNALLKVYPRSRALRRVRNELESS